MAAQPSTRLLLATARRSRERLVLIGVLVAASAAIGLFVPLLLADAVDAAFRGVDVRWPVGLLALVVVGRSAMEAVLGLLTSRVTGNATTWLQVRSVDYLLRLGGRSTVPVGDAAARLAQGASGMAGLPIVLTRSAVSIVSSVAALVVIWVIDWLVGLAFTLLLPAAFLLARRFISRTTEAQTRYLRAQSSIAGRLLGALAGARTIRAAGSTATEVTRVLAPLAEVSAAGRDLWRLQRGVVWQLGLLLPLSQVIVLGVAGAGLAAGRIDPADLLAITGYLALASAALGQIDVLLQVASIRASAGRVADMLADPIPVGGTVWPNVGGGAVNLRDVTVRRGDTVVLDSVDLDVPAGASVAIVGASGSGKSLLAALIGRLADPDHGTVLLDGVPVEAYSLGELHRRVTYAFERPELVGVTVREAIRYGLSGLPDAQVVAAARAAGADGFIRRLPHGYDTALADAPMSGGERQRVGLARALVRPASVFIFDDATAGLDTVTEAEVSSTITSLLAGRTRLIIAHRASTAARCDLVAWLADGRVRAVQPHQMLWRDPAYRAVFAAGEADTTAAADTTAVMEPARA